MATHYYGPLRDAHQKALDALNDHIDKAPEIAPEARQLDREPSRPEAQVLQSPGWTAGGGLVQQQASANEMAKRNNEARLAAYKEMQEHIDSGQVQLSPGQSLGRPGDIER